MVAGEGAIGEFGPFHVAVVEPPETLGLAREAAGRTPVPPPMPSPAVPVPPTAREARPGPPIRTAMPRTRDPPRRPIARGRPSRPRPVTPVAPPAPVVAPPAPIAVPPAPAVPVPGGGAAMSTLLMNCVSSPS